MEIATELKKFTADAKKRGLDLSGDKERFFKLKTARAWTAWVEKAGK
jgi:hypothetical protein